METFVMAREQARVTLTEAQELLGASRELVEKWDRGVVSPPAQVIQVLRGLALCGSGKSHSDGARESLHSAQLHLPPARPAEARIHRLENPQLQKLSLAIDSPTANSNPEPLGNHSPPHLGRGEDTPIVPMHAPKPKQCVFQGQQIFFSDARDMSCIKDASVDFFMTSPPYWNLKDYGDSALEIGDSDYERYLDDLKVVFSQCFQKARNGAVLVVNINSRRSKGVFYPIAFDIVRTVRDWTFWDQNIWYVPNALPQPNHYMERLLDNKFESLLVFVKGDPKSYTCHKPRVPQKYIAADPRSEKKNVRGRCLGNILRIPAYRPPNVRSMNYHVAAYPEELVSFFLETYTDPGDVVLDPFLGSGTTLKVCRVMRRKGLGFEVHADYTSLIEARIGEEWEIPDWKSIDILHSATNVPGMNGRRKPALEKSWESDASTLL